VISDLGASGYADRALRGFRHVKIKKTIHGFFDFDATATRPFNPLRTNRKAPSGLSFAERIAVAPQPPLAWNFARPYSGARRATWLTNNTLRVPHRAPPSAWNFARPYSGARRATWLTNNTLRVPHRAPLTQRRARPCFPSFPQLSVKAEGRPDLFVLFVRFVV
jgi:hypothetical protein